MELKKSKSAELDDKRTTWFLLGLIFVLSVLFTALEYTSPDSTAATDDELLDDMSMDMEPYPAVDDKNYVAAQGGTRGKASPDRLKVATTDVQAEKESVGQGLDADGEGQEAAVGSAVGGTTQTAVPSAEQAETDKPIDFRIVEQLPEFPGGMGAFVQWLTSNLKYPQSAKTQKVEGRVVVTFIINKDGSIASAKVSKSVHPLLDREAMRVIGMMPKWKPGLQNDKPCRTMFAIPINFKL